MLKTTHIALTAALALTCHVGSLANDIDASKETYKAPQKTVAHLGTMSGWAGVPVYKNTGFAIPKGTGAANASNLVTFEEYGGGVWSGPSDQSVAFSVAWDADNLYVGVVVTDDSHQNSNSGWNGDALQIAFTDPDRTAITHLYNYALDGTDGDLKEVVISNEKGPGGAEVHVVRNSAASETYYEIRFPASAIPDSVPGGKFEAGMKFGLGLCVNDGEAEDGQQGQKGWGGWGAHAIVFGKTAAEAGQIVLEAGTPLERRNLPDGSYQLGMKADAPKASKITVDGHLDDWAGRTFTGPTPFQSPKRDPNGSLVYFQEYDGGVWNGPEDQTTSFAFAWDADNFYIGAIVTDDSHQNGNSGWNGDALQVLFANDARDTVAFLYNYALGGTDAALGDVVVNHERGPGGTEAGIWRDTANHKTYYEIKVPITALERANLAVGQKVNVALCVNDGEDEEGQRGQKGWSGWGPHAIVFGKSAEYAGEVTLTAGAATPSADAPTYDATPAGLIKLDGEALDWGSHTYVGPTPFKLPKANPTDLVLFEEYGGGIWNGPDDQTVIEAFAWEKDAFYIGVVVTDDSHQNSNSGWNGDALQILLTNEARDPYYLYNYALGGTDAEPGDQVRSDERTPAAFDKPSFFVSRRGLATVYEVKVPASAVGLTQFTEGQKIGVSLCVNDGEAEDGQQGQKGWSGFAPHGIVFGKSPEKAGLVTLKGSGSTPPPVTPTVSIARSAAGLSVTFKGTLQAADNVAGPYTDVTGATSPFTPASAGAKYYRARQ